MFMSRNKLCEIFVSLANQIESDYNTIVDILSQIETKKTAKKEIEKAVKLLKTFNYEDKYLKKTEPIGVVAAFLPFNLPLYSLVLYGFGALYAGNTVYVKPSRFTCEPLIQIEQLLNKYLSQLKLTIIKTGSHNGEGGTKFLFDAINKYHASAIIFTGKYSSILNIKKAIPSSTKLIYCGSGVCPLIVRESADLLRAVDIAVESKLFNSGQDCLSTEKIYVHRLVFDLFIEKLLERIKKVKVGPNDDEYVDVGPLISKELADNATDIVKRSSGRVILNGKQIGNTVYPSVIISAFDSSEFNAEKFAPIFVISEYSDDDAMINDANAGGYCLGITVVGNEFPAGTFRAAHVEYNRSLLEYEEEYAHSPFGGYGKSGFVCDNGLMCEGPILISVETSKRETDQRIGC